MLYTSSLIVRWLFDGTSKSVGTGVPMMAAGCIGVRDEDGTRASVYDWPSSSKSSMGAVGTVSCASTMMTGSRSIM